MASQERKEEMNPLDMTAQQVEDALSHLRESTNNEIALIACILTNAFQGSINAAKARQAAASDLKQASQALAEDITTSSENQGTEH